MLEKIDKLVELGDYPNRSEAIRDSVRRLLEYRSNQNELLNISIKDLQRYIRDNKK